MEKKKIEQGIIKPKKAILLDYPNKLFKKAVDFEGGIEEMEDLDLLDNNWKENWKEYEVIMRDEFYED
jgi:hypothetical protein